MLAALTGDVILMMGMTDKKMSGTVGRAAYFLLQHLRNTMKMK